MKKIILLMFLLMLPIAHSLSIPDVKSPQLQESKTITTVNQKIQTPLKIECKLGQTTCFKNTKLNLEYFRECKKTSSGDQIFANIQTCSPPSYCDNKKGCVKKEPLAKPIIAQPKIIKPLTPDNSLKSKKIILPPKENTKSQELRTNLIRQKRELKLKLEQSRKDINKIEETTSEQKISKQKLKKNVEDLEEQLNTIGDDQQLSQVDLQNSLQKMQQLLQTMSSISKATHDATMAVVRKSSALTSEESQAQKRASQKELNNIIRDVEEQQETLKDKRQTALTYIQTTDQKTNQMYNVVSSVSKSINQKRVGTTSKALTSEESKNLSRELNTKTNKDQAQKLAGLNEEMNNISMSRKAIQNTLRENMLVQEEKPKLNIPSKKETIAGKAWKWMKNIFDAEKPVAKDFKKPNLLDNLPEIPILEEPGCQDPDGVDVTRATTVIYKKCDTCPTETETDECTGTSLYTVNEFYCDGNEAKSNFLRCNEDNVLNADRKICKKGKCVLESTAGDQDELEREAYENDGDFLSSINGANTEYPYCLDYRNLGKSNPNYDRTNRPNKIVYRECENLGDCGPLITAKDHCEGTVLVTHSCTEYTTVANEVTINRYDCATHPQKKWCAERPWGAECVDRLEGEDIINPRSGEQCEIGPYDRIQYKECENCEWKQFPDHCIENNILLNYECRNNRVQESSQDCAGINWVCSPGEVRCHRPGETVDRVPEEPEQTGPATLTVNMFGSHGSSGTIISSPRGIDCGTDCSETYSAETRVVLTATPDSRSTFNTWGGACAGNSTTCTVIMRDRSKQAIAYFTAES